MLQTMPIVRPTPYASSDDFQQIFSEDMNGLYLLSFLLTADREKAEQCFVSGLEDAVEGNPVFREWARSWARRAIILNAVRSINPRPEGSQRPSSAAISGDDETLPAERQVEIAAVLGLEAFERFVYVMTILERYSDYECSLLLGCARREVVDARARTILQLGKVMEMHYKQLPDASSEKAASHERYSSLLESLVAPRLATPA
jgi:hypothetical protein